MKKISAAALVTIGSLAIMVSPVLAQPAPGDDVEIGITPPDQVGIRNINRLIGSLIGSIIVIAIVVALFYLLWGGFQWITSGGDKGNVEAAQKKIQAALVGLIIIAATYAVFTIVAAWLGFDLTNLRLPSPVGE